VMAAAATPLLLVAGRLLQGTFGGVVEAAAAFAGSTGSDKKRGSSLGKSFSATAAGALVGPIAGGLFVGAGGLRQLMLVIAATAAVLAVGCGAGLQEPSRPHTTGAAAERQRKGGAMRTPGAMPLALAAVGAYFGVYGLIPVFAEHVSGIVTPGAASIWVGVLHSVMWGATLLGSFWWGKHNDATQRPVRTFALAAGGCAVSIVAVVLPLGALALTPVRLIQGFCFAALAQSLFLHFSRHAPEERKSSDVGMANSFLLVGQSAGPLLAGPLVSVLPASGAITVMGAACGLACLLALGPAQAEKDSSQDDSHDSQPGQEETIRLPVITRTSGPARLSDQRPCSGVNVQPLDAWRLVPERLRGRPDRHATPWAQPSTASRVLDDWKRSGVLVREQQPALYAYAQTGPQGTQRGLIAGVHLDSRLLPHEEVNPAQVRDMAELMHAGNLNLAPIQLGYSGDGTTSAHLGRIMNRAPLAEVFTTEGQEHRLWRLPETAHEDIAYELRSRPALIADGHHRHTAARQLRRQLYAEGHGAGPWDFLPAVLVDIQQSPLRLAPIHRVLPHLEPRRALATAQGFRIVPLTGPLEEWLDVLRARAYRSPSLVVVTRKEAFLLTEPDPRFLRDALGHRPEPLRRMHVSVLHDLIDKVWKVPDSPEHLRFETSATHVVRQVRERGGIAVLQTPPHQRELQATAAAGLRLPRKATFFAPKPHEGLIFRTLDVPARKSTVDGH
jgi:MFS family permease